VPILTSSFDSRHGALDGDGHLEVVSTPEWLSAIVAVVPAQLLAVGAAERLGLDVDRPSGLEKITRTR
jgi:glucosamine--fructose-6-phosphate aminotransferase (isomerizing)